VVKTAAVLDSTCLIGLENIGRLDIAEALLQPAYAPPAVEREFGAAPPWLQIIAPGNETLVVSLKMMLDEGEAEAIALAQEKGLRVILDDRKARGVALT
jgi:predicted nucleic acid-binding protein